MMICLIQFHLLYLQVKRWITGRRAGLNRNLLGLVLCLFLNVALPAQPPQEPAVTNPRGSLNTMPSTTAGPPRFQRIFVPEEQVGKLVPRDYMPIAVDDLELLLSNESNVDAEAWTTIPKLSNASYFVRLRDNELISDLSLWKIDYPDDTPNYLKVAPWNVAITNLTDENLADLVEWADRPNWLVDDRQNLWLTIWDDTPVAFAWKSLAQDTSEGTRQFSLSFPNATRNQILLALDSNLTLTVSAGVARILPPGQVRFAGTGNLAELFQAAFNAWQQKYSQQDQRIWQIDFSGNTAIELKISVDKKEANPAARSITASLLQQYRLNTSGVELITRATMLHPITSGNLYLDVEEPLKIKEIRLGNEVLAWSAVEDRTKQVRVELSDISDATRLGQLQVSSFAPVDSWDDSRLPAVQISNSVVLRGDTIVDFRDTLVPLDISISGADTSIATEAVTPNSESPGRWQWRWSGHIPEIRLSATVMQRTVRASALTRLNLVKGSLGATGWLRINPVFKGGGETRLDLGEGWILDNVITTPGAKLLVTEDTSPNGSSVLLRWDEYLDEEQLTVELQAHRAVETDASEIKLPSTPLFKLHNGSLTGVIAVETTGRFLLKPTPLLISLLLGESELLDWQRNRLPRFSNSWLLYSEQGKLPELVFTSEPSTYTGALDVFVRPRGDLIEEEYRLQFRPLFGAMDRVSVRFKQARTEPLLWLWEDGERQYTLQASRELGMNAAEGESYVITLPRPLSEPFELKSSRTVEAKNWQAIAWPTSDQATNEEIRLHISSSLEIQQPETGWKALPPVQADSLESLATYRADSNLANDILARIAPQSQAPKCWAEVATHQHWHSRDGRIVHVSSWKLENSSNQILPIKLPNGVELVEARFDEDILRTAVDPSSDSTFLLRLPSQDRGTLVVVYRQDSSPLHFRTQVGYTKAQLSCGVMSFRDFVVLPPENTPFRISELAKEGTSPSSAIRVGEFIWDLLTASDNLAFAAATQAAYLPVDNQINGITLPEHWRHYLVAQGSVAGTESISVTVWDSRVLRVWVLLCWLFVFMGASWMFLRTPRAVLFCSLVLLATIFITPQSISLCITFVGTSFVAAIFFGIVRHGIMSRKSGIKLTPSARVSHSAAKRVSTIPSILIALWSLVAVSIDQNSAWGQMATSSDEAASPTYGILIPYTPKGELKGSYVYIPIEAYNLIGSLGGRTYAPRSPYMFRSANYQIRASDNMPMAANATYQVIAEYDIDVVDATVPVTWAIGSTNARLDRLIVNQFEIIPGFTVKQDESQIRWMPERNGMFRVRLLLQLKGAEAKGAEQFELPIPVVPTGTVSYVAPNSKRIAISNVLAEESGGLRPALLGTTDKLRFTVESNPSTELAAEVVDAEIDAWLHFQSDKPLLLTQCRVRQTNPTPLKALSLQMDERWQPLGTNWGDGKWDGLASSTSSLGTRSYEVAVQSASMTDIVIYTVWEPSSQWLTPDAVPPMYPESKFFNVTLYTLTTSRSEDSPWNLEVPDSWSPEAPDRAFVRWEGRGLAVTNSSFSNSSRSQMPILRRGNSPSKVDLVEACDCTIRQTFLELNYEAQWRESPNAGTILQFAIPPQASVSELRINNTAVKQYEIIEGLGSKTLVIAEGNTTANERSSLQCRLVISYTNQELQTIPRMTALQMPVSSSTFRLYREVNLAVQLEDVELVPESRQILDRSSDEMLAFDQVGLLQVDLTNRFVETPTLPLQFTVAPASSFLSGETLGVLGIQDDKWKYTLVTHLRSAESPVDSLVLELPASINSEITVDPPCAFRLDPSPDGTHQLLSLFPTEPLLDEQTHRVTFELPRSNNQVSLPQVTLIGTDKVQQWIALPQSSGKSNYTWRTTGLRPDLPPQIIQSLSDSIVGVRVESQQYFEPIARRYQADLQSGKSDSPAITAWLALHHLRANSFSLDVSRPMQLQSTYWLDPAGFLKADFALNKQQKLVGVRLNGIPVTPLEQQESNSFSIGITPSDLPIKLEIFCEILAVDNATGMDLTIPTSTDIQVQSSILCVTGEGYLASDELGAASFYQNQELLSPLSRTAAYGEIINSIVQLIKNADTTLGTYSQESLTQWKSQWRSELARYPKPKGDKSSYDIVIGRLVEDSTVSHDIAGAEGREIRSKLDDIGPNSIFLRCDGALASLSIRMSPQPFQVPLAWLIAGSIVAVGTSWLISSKMRVTQVRDYLSSVPAIACALAAMLVLVLFESLWLTTAFSLLAVINIVCQIGWYWKAGRLYFSGTRPSKQKSLT